MSRIQELVELVKTHSRESKRLDDCKASLLSVARSEDHPAWDYIHEIAKRSEEHYRIYIDSLDEVIGLVRQQEIDSKLSE